jgi:hypothetical protein
MRMKMTTSNYGINTVSITDPKTKKEITYFLEPWIRSKFDSKIIPELHKKDKDCIIAVDGKEGAGKSTLGLQICKYIDASFNLSRVVFTPDEFREAIYKAEKGQAIMFDEAFTGFSSRASLSGVNRTLVSLMMQIRQKNLFIVIILPTIFLLDRYISIFRTRVLIHVYENKGRRGFFRVYSSKKKRQLILHKDAKVYAYGIKSNKKGRFYGVFALGDEKEEAKYRKKKLEALNSAEHNPMTSTGVKYREQRDIMIYVLRKELKKSYKKIESLLNDYNFDVTYAQIRNVCIKFGDKEDEQQKKHKDLEETEETDDSESDPPI